MMEEIVNRVANSSLVSLDMDEYIDDSDRVYFDIRDGLFQGVLLREKEFRQFVKEHDWSIYTDKNVGVFCSEDTIIPTWAYMLVVAKLQPVANIVALGHEDALEQEIITHAIAKITSENLQDARVVIKGCGDIKNRDYAYFELTKRLTPIVSSIMYGEPCSTVPVYKKPRRSDKS